MYVSENELPGSNWLPGEPSYGSNCAVITNTKYRTGWKSVNCSERHTTICVGETGAHGNKKYILLHISIMNKQFGIPSVPVCTSI